MLDSGNLRKFMDKIDLTQQRQEKRVTDAYRKVIETMFVDLVKHTPQFTGNLVHGWQIVTVNRPPSNTEAYSKEYRDSHYREYASALARGSTPNWLPYEAGDDPAVTEVIDREIPKLYNIRYNSIVKIVNTVEYADAVDAGEGPEGLDGQQNDIRPENLHYGKVFMLGYAMMKYGNKVRLERITR